MNVDYNPYEGREVQGVPTTVLSRGKVIVDKGQFLGKAGEGQFVPRKTYTLVIICNFTAQRKSKMTLDISAINAAQVKEDSAKHVMVSWAAQKAANTNPLVVTEARGCWFWDSDGKRYLDFSSQLINSNLGHQHPKVVAAIKEQAEKLCYIGPNFQNEARATLARMLAERTPGDLVKTLFTNGGAEANENAIKMARAFTGRQKIITRYRSYHGSTAGAMTLSGDNRRWANEPGIAGIVRVHDSDPYHCRFAGCGDTCTMQCAYDIEDVLHFEGPETVAAILIEVVTGTNGIFVPPPDYIPYLRQLCDKYGILLIFDEVMTGFRAHWQMVCRRPLWRNPRHYDFCQRGQFGLCAVGRGDCQPETFGFLMKTRCSGAV